MDDKLVEERSMRRFVLSLVVPLMALSAAYAQEQSASPGQSTGPDESAGPEKSTGSEKGAGSEKSTGPHKSKGPETGVAPALGSPDSATSALPGVYGLPKSAPGHLRGVYGPSRTQAATPLSSHLSGSANSNQDNVPSVSIPGTVRDGQSLPEGVQVSPMSDRPGYGRARVNGRLAIIDLNGNRIVQFLDSPGQFGGIAGSAPGELGGGSGQLSGVHGAQTPAQASSFAPLSSTLTGSINSGTTYGPYTPGYVPGAVLPGGAQTPPSPYGATGYGQAWVNGSIVTYDRSNNRIINVQNMR
jgi:hypothetical protein